MDPTEAACIASKSELGVFMLKSFTNGTAGIAIAASLVGTAHAQEFLADLPASSEETEVVFVSAQTDESTQEDEDNTAPGYVLADENIAFPADIETHYPMQLLAADAEFNAAPISIASDIVGSGQLVTTPSVPAPQSDGIVTPKGVDPFYGDINPFYGDIRPFYGDIDAFYGNINPFYGDINPFYGDIDAFWGDINPFYGDINPFYGDIDAFWGDIRPFDEGHLQTLGKFGEQSGMQIGVTEGYWSKLIYEKYDGKYLLEWNGTPGKIQSALKALIAQAEAQFGAEYTARTGKSLTHDLAVEIMARHGINVNSKVSFAGKSATDRAAFYLDWHDSLMTYSGIDHVDHWMAAINWNPSITQIQGSGADTVIGIIDGNFSTDADLGNNIVWAGGNSNSVDGHGAGVASLIAAAHDGEGVMGIAPKVNIATYNPFDASGQTNWGAVADGFVALKKADVGGGNTSIVNLSLGESGSIFTSGTASFLYRWDVDNYYHNTVFVFAAGNDGITQNHNVEFNDVDETALIFVGSINPLGEISNFSNRPGTGCLTDGRVCYAGNRLMDRFLVAPGELLLVSDGQGGVVRRSGTSFAAPLVSGAISLLHDRWQWLANHPHETAEIIFRSATDLGAPGVDEVYGHGLLDLTASQSPLDFNAMKFRSYQKIGSYLAQRDVSTIELIYGGIPSWWETDDVYFTMFETIGDTYRDFAVPVSAFQYGKSTNALGRNERMQDFISKRFFRWIKSRGSDKNGNGKKAGFSEVRSNGAELNGDWALRYDAIMPTVTPEGTWRPVHSAATLTNPNGTMSFTLGHGQGAMALGGYRFGVISDHDPFTGGANPVLGFASGEIFAAASYQVAPGMNVKVGYSENREEWDEVTGLTAEQSLIRRQLGDRPANAFTLDIEQQVSDSLSLGLNYTRLREVNAILGTQTSSTALLGNGSNTEAMTVSASLDVGNGLSFDLSATGARTETADGQIFANAGDIWSTAGQFTATKQGLFSGKDSLRVSLAQPLQIEEGELSVTSEVVVDRATGETAPVTQTFGIETRRRITGEAVLALHKQPHRHRDSASDHR